MLRHQMTPDLRPATEASTSQVASVDKVDKVPNWVVSRNQQPKNRQMELRDKLVVGGIGKHPAVSLVHTL